MKVFSSFVFLALLSGAAAVSNEVKSPVEKVVKLLEELKADLERDQKVEQQIYDKYACWCETTSGEKAAKIMLMESDVFKLTQEVLELKGEVAVLSKEIADKSIKIAANEKFIKDSTAVRQGENADWMAEKAELEEAIDALERAIKVLSGQVNFVGKNKALLQDSDAESQEARTKAMTSIRSVVRALPSNANLGPKKLAAIQDFAKHLQEPQAADDSASYAPQSATVQGILKDMYDTFTADLESITVKEAQSQKQYEEAVHDTTVELNGDDETKGLIQMVAEAEDKKAEAAQNLADTIQELDDTKKELEALKEFFDMMKGACKAKHEEWELRKSQRLEEIEGIKKALEILTSDEARALFANAIKPGMETSFMQLDSDSTATDATMKAYNVLKDQAKKSHSMRLAALAATVRTMGHGHFDKVIKKIDEIIQTLKDEEAEDIKQRDWCKDEYQENSEEKAELKWKIKNNEAMIVKLTKIIDGLVEQIEACVKEIEATKEQIKQMEDERKDEHEEFQNAKSDDEKAIELLEKTKEVLSSYYEKNKIDIGPVQGSSKLLQQQGPEFEISKDQAPDATFSDKGSRKNQGKGIISIITMIIEDLEAEIKNGIKDEVSAQAEFEKNVDAAKKLIADLEEKKSNLEDDKAETESKRDDESEDKKSNEKNLENNEEYLKSIKPDCDWMLNSFEERREKRKAEMNGLVQAKEYLSGGAPPAMMQAATSFDDSRLEQISFTSLRR